VLKIILGKLL